MKLVDKSEIEGALIKADENGVWVEAGKGNFGGADFGVSESSGARGDISSANVDSSDEKPAGKNAVFIPYNDIRRAKTIFEW